MDGMAWLRPLMCTVFGYTHTQSLSALLVAGGGLATLSAPSLHRETRVAGLECQD